jgi:serine/threonine protein kinase
MTSESQSLLTAWSFEGPPLRQVAVSGAMTVDHSPSSLSSWRMGSWQHMNVASCIEIEPENIIVSPDDIAKTDFGIAKTELPAQANGHHVDTLAHPHRRHPGTAGYMSPEQARGLVGLPVGSIHSVHPLRLATGGERLNASIEALVAVIVDEPGHQSACCELAAAAAMTIERCLSKSPDDRYLRHATAS